MSTRRRIRKQRLAERGWDMASDIACGGVTCQPERPLILAGHAIEWEHYEHGLLVRRSCIIARRASQTDFSDSDQGSSAEAVNNIALECMKHERSGLAETKSRPARGKWDGPLIASFEPLPWKPLGIITLFI